KGLGPVGRRRDHRRRFARRPGRHVGLRDEAREIKLDRGALPALAVGAQVTAGLLDEAVDLAEAEPGADARRLGGEERLEHPAHPFPRNTAAGTAPPTPPSTPP